MQATLFWKVLNDFADVRAQRFAAPNATKQQPQRTCNSEAERFGGLPGCVIITQQRSTTRFMQ